MLHRTKKHSDINAGKWIGVGGKFEKEESPEECLLREVQEETGLTLTRWRFRGIVTFIAQNEQGQTEMGEYMHLFTADRWRGELRDCPEGDLAWVPKEQLDQLNLWPGDRIFLRLLQEDAPFFSLKLTYRGDRLYSAVLNGQGVCHEQTRRLP